jgi:isoquinoline 1-oxidoreductase subunit beta
MVRRKKAGQMHGVDRRQMLIGGGVGIGLIIAWAAWPRSYAQNLVAAKGEHIFGPFVKIGEDGHVSVVIPQIEMGQGVYTALAQILADELGADWRTIAIEPAPINPLYTNHLVAADWSKGLGTQLLGDVASWYQDRSATQNALQITGGSSSLRAFEPLMRGAGATARALLCMAAAKRWDADWLACDTAAGFVILGNDRLRFGELAGIAASLTPPSRPPFRQGSDNRLRGKNLPRLDLPSKVDGSANYAADIRLPGMVYAALRTGPLGDTIFKSIDDKAVRAKAGVIDVITEESWVAVVATTWWGAHQALERGAPRFETRGPFPDSKTAFARLDAAFATSGKAHTEIGDVGKVFAAGKIIRADFPVLPEQQQRARLAMMKMMSSCIR